MFRDSQKLTTRIKSNYAREICFQPSNRKREIHVFDLGKLETLHGRLCMCWGVKYLHQMCDPQTAWTRNRTWNDRMYNTVGAPGEFVALASIEKRQYVLKKAYLPSL